jgi:hypothetical protein
MAAKMACWIFGILFVGIGLVLILRGADVDRYHNLLHVATGMVMLGVGASRSASAARACCLGFGAFYLALGGLGMVLGDPSLDRLWQAGPLSLDVGDHGFHVVLGLILLASGALTKRTMPRPRQAVRG